MSQVRAKAEELAKAIKESPEFARLKAAQARLAENTAAQIMYSDFQKLQLEVEKMRLSGEEVPEAKLEEVRKKYELLMFNEDIKEIIMAEAELSQLMVEIQQILAESLGLLRPAGDDQTVN
ncbi:MAG: YlbF family regulator [Firmicutes bacterium]|nr:YlbF family regulator [Bacillota bacterium]